jgi:SAM-dependent methyltransferase
MLETTARPDSASPRDYASFRELEPLPKFPGFKSAPAFLKAEIEARGSRSIADLGGGANPMLDEAFVTNNGLRYQVLDISDTELRKGPAYCDKICVDICAPADLFDQRVRANSVDLAFSHMFLEHIREPDIAHRNIHRALRPGGVAVHFYPSPNNIPLFINKILPTDLSTSLVRMFQPERDLEGRLGKFPAYYKLCGKSSEFLRSHFKTLGFDVVCHTGFVGHGYYLRFPIIHKIGKALRAPVIAAGIRATSFELLILQKQTTA